LDIVPRLITYNIDGTNAVADVNKYTFATAGTDVKLALNPLNLLYTTVNTFIT